MSNKGFLYENKVNANLKKAKLLTPGFNPAGANANAPDAKIRYQGEDYKIEIKLDTKVDFGQGSLDYGVIDGVWRLGGAKTIPAQQMREFLDSIGVPELVNKVWGPKGAPRKFTVPLKQFKKEDVEYDYKTFKDEFIDIPNNAVTNYYNSKDTYYIQIGKSGLFYMGKDPANLGVSELNIKLKLRIRIKRGGSIPIYNYRFTTAILASSNIINSSKYDLDDQEYLKALSARSIKQ
jgi:hypothetical protein